MASAHRANGGLRREHSRSPVSVVYESEFKRSSMRLQRTIADASGRSRTEPKRFIRKRPLTSGRWTPSCQGGCRGFDPRFPLHSSLPLAPDLRLSAHRRAARQAAGSTARLTRRSLSLPRREAPPLGYFAETPHAASV